MVAKEEFYQELTRADKQKLRKQKLKEQGVEPVKKKVGKKSETAKKVLERIAKQKTGPSKWRVFNDTLAGHPTNMTGYQFHKSTRAVIQCDKDYKFIWVHTSLTEAGRVTGIDKKTIGDACKGYKVIKKGVQVKVHTAGGYRWFYKNNPPAIYYKVNPTMKLEDGKTSG